MIKKSFSMIELIFVMVIVGILAIFVTPKFCGDACGKSADLIKAANQVLGHIRYTRHLAMVDNKFQPYPLDSLSNQEIDRSKYWFKQWWQIYFTDTNDYIIYYIYSDSPRDSTSTSFNKKITNSQDYELAIDPLTGKYLSGNWKDLNSDFPEESQVVTNLNLTKTYAIDKIEITDTTYRVSSMPNPLGHRVRILFDNLGRPYFNEYKDSSDSLNPYNFDDRLKLLNRIGIILHQGSQSISICMEPETGYSYIDYEGTCS